MNKTISVKEAQKILNSLVNQDIFLSCGYGGVMFVEIGNITNHTFKYEKGKSITRKYGECRLFCDENWSFYDDKDIRIDRWTSSSFETDELLESLGVRKLEKVEVVNEFEQTRFHISGGYTFTIIKDDSIDTFSVVFIPDKKKLTVFGNGNIEYIDYEEDLSYMKKGKPRPKFTKSISVDRTFLRNQMPDVLPLSYQKTQEFITPLFNHKIKSIEVTSATRFSLNFGEDCRKLLSRENQKTWATPMFRWSLSVDENWVLEKNEEVLLDVREEKFYFEEKLKKLLKDKYLVDIIFDKNGAKTKIQLSDDYTLVILETGRYSKWDIHDFKTGFTVGSYRDQGLIYWVSSPIHVIDEFKTGDVHLDAILYEMKFYRDYFAKNVV
jgi:hypothetical protein